MEMTQDLIQPPDDEFDILQEDDLSCNVAEILDFCDRGELFADATRTSEVESCSGGGAGGGSACDATAAAVAGGGCGAGNSASSGGGGSNGENMCGGGGGGMQEEVSFTSPFSPLSSMDISEFSALLDGAQPLLDFPVVNAEDPLMAGCCYQTPSSPPMGCGGGAAFTVQPPPLQHQGDDQQDQFAHIELVPAGVNGFTAACLQDLSASQLASAVVLQHQQAHMTSQMQGMAVPPTFADDCMGNNHLRTGYHRLKPSGQPMPCELMEPLGINIGMYYPGNMGGVPMFGDRPFSDSLLDACDRVALMPEEYHAENVGFYGMPTNNQQGYGYGEIKQPIGGCTSPTTPVSEISSMDEPATYGQKISSEEKQEKIHRYRVKKSARNYTKKIKYECRKTLADSRPRVRGRFAKNEEETRPSHRGQEDEDEPKVVIKDDPDSSDLFMQLNSFKCNFTLESFV